MTSDPTGACKRCGEVHERCSAHNRAGRPCGRYPVPGARVCRLHGGAAPQVKAAAEVRLVSERARAELLRFGAPADDVHPLEAAYRVMLEALGDREWARAQLAADVAETGPAGALMADNQGRLKGSVWWDLAAEAEARFRVLARTLIDANFENRRLELAEREAGRIARAIVGALKALGHDTGTDEVRRAIAEALRAEAAADEPPALTTGP